MELNAKALGLAGGIVWGLSIFLLTWWFLIYGHLGRILEKLGGIYLGYSVTWYGSFIGLIWGFIDGFITFFIIAWLYNKFAKSA